MASILTQLLIDVDQLPPSERKNKLVGYALKQDEATLRKELDAKLDAFQIVPKDYALLLHAVRSVPWAMDILNTSYDHPSIVTTAVDILGKSWRKDPLVVRDVFGDGSKELIKLIDTALPRYATARLFRAFGTVARVSPAHSSTVDDILAAIFPFLSNGPTPLARYSRSSIIVLFAAASPSIVMAIVQRCSAWFNEATWQRLAESRPKLVENVLLRQVLPVQEISHAPEEELITEKNWNRVIMWALLRERKDRTFFTRFLDQYVSRTLVDKDRPDVFGAYRSNRTNILFDFAAFVLRKRTGPGEILQTAIEFCEALTRLVDAGACDEWTWNAARPLLEIACHEFGKSPDAWSLTHTELPTTKSYPPTPPGLLLTIFKKHAYSATIFSSPDPTLIHLLRSLPLPGRLPFLDLLYRMKTSEGLIDVPKNQATFPSFSVFLLSLLYPTHGRALFEVGTKARGEMFLSSQTRHSRSRLYDFSQLSVADATSPILFACWAGIEQSGLRMRATELVEAGDATVRDVEAYKKKAIRSRDNRPNLVKETLVLSVTSRLPSLFIDTLSWVVDRYAKDPDTSPFILSWVTDEYQQNQYVIDFLSGPVGIYVSHRTSDRLTKDMLVTWCMKTNKTFVLLLDLLRVWINEPSYVSTIQHKHSLIGSLLFKVLERRIGKSGSRCLNQFR
jgi:hypothetical protein